VGATVVESDGIEYRFYCHKCDFGGEYHRDDEGQAQAEGLQHEASWHHGLVEVRGAEDHWHWRCEVCDQGSGDSHYETEEEAWSDGWQHVFSWHPRVYVVEGRGYYRD
jgi:hypothetical protein